MRFRSTRGSLLAIVALLSTSLAVLSAAPAAADGTETLGLPSVPVASGTGLAVGGTGMFAQPGTIDVTVPAGAAVRQVLLYWQGVATAGNEDDTITVNGTAVRGIRIGGPTFFFRASGVDHFASSFRADITDRGLVRPGSNTLTVAGMEFDRENDGAGVVVVFDDGSGATGIQLRDGVDTAFAGFSGQLRATVPQTFNFDPVTFARTAQLSLMVGGVGADRPNAVAITVDGNVQKLVNPLKDSAGAQWDVLTVPVAVPAGADSITVEVLSEGDGSGRVPASLVWVNAALSLPGCPPAPRIDPSSRGAAFALDADVLGGTVTIDELSRIDTRAPGPHQTASEQVGSVNVPGVVTTPLLHTRSQSSVAGGVSETRAQATTADLSLLGGAITATLVRGVSHSVASFNGATFDSFGSTFVNLRINGTQVVDVAPNTKVSVRAPLAPDVAAGIGNILAPSAVQGPPIIAEAVLREEAGDSSFQPGVTRASHSINMIHVTLLEQFGELSPGSEIIVSHAESEAVARADPCAQPKRVSGLAFTASAEADLDDPIDARVTGRIGQAELPPTGGSARTELADVDEPGLIRSATAVNTTSGSLQPHPNATSRAVVEQADLLGGLITADLLDVRATSTADGTTADTMFDVTFANLVIAGTAVDVDPGPNTTVTVDLPDGSRLVVVLNEQIERGDGRRHTEGTVNAVHATLFVRGIVTAEVIVASAHSDAHLD